MIYAITTGDNVVALTDDANAAVRLNASGKHGVLACRWANEAERAKFRKLEHAAASRRARRSRWLGWLAWLWPAPLVF